MRKFRRKPTKSQALMIVLMGIAMAALIAWSIPELIGVFSPEAEDTYSEWVWDLPFGAVLGIAAFHVVAGVLFIWSAGHFLEGYSRRRAIEKGTWREEPPSAPEQGPDGE